jgi:hypothetical protein
MKRLVIKLLGYIFHIFKTAYYMNICSEYREKYDFDKAFNFNGDGEIHI